MPNANQLKVFDTFLGRESIFIKCIQNYSGIDMHTKTYCLYQAITENAVDFETKAFQQLNITHRSDITPAEHAHFLSAMKVVTDICLNKSVACVASFKDWLRALGEINNEEFVVTVHGMIRERITEFTAPDSDMVAKKTEDDHFDILEKSRYSLFSPITVGRLKRLPYEPECIPTRAIASRAMDHAFFSRQPTSFSVAATEKFQSSAKLGFFEPKPQMLPPRSLQQLPAVLSRLVMSGELDLDSALNIPWSRYDAISKGSSADPLTKELQQLRFGEIRPI